MIYNSGTISSYEFYRKYMIYTTYCSGTLNFRQVFSVIIGQMVRHYEAD